MNYWTRGQLIGHGSSAAVSLGRGLSKGDIFAVKSIELSRSNALRKEQEIHSSLDCDRIIGYKGCDITFENGHSCYNILLEYASGGTILDVIRRKGSGLDDSLIRQYTEEILQGLEHLHCKGIVHCDIKGANVLVTSEGVKIGDFGCARRVDDVAGRHSSVVELAGTPMYMAPEVARGEQQGYPADVWALGCTVLEMATGLAPWPNIDHNTVSALYRIGFSNEVPEIPGFLPGRAQDFLSKCLKRDPNERWSVAQLLNHPFVVNDDGLAKFTTKEAHGPKFDAKEAHGPSFDSPTSVLGQGLWESVEEMGLTQTNVAQERSKESPSDRLRDLSLGQEFSCWACDEDWVTVRSNPCDEAEKVFNGLGLVEPNIATALIESCPIIGLDFPFLSIEFLNCFDNVYDMEYYVGKSKNCETKNGGRTCNCMKHDSYENDSLSKFIKIFNFFKKFFC